MQPQEPIRIDSYSFPFKMLSVKDHTFAPFSHGDHI